MCPILCSGVHSWTLSSTQSSDAREPPVNEADALRRPKTGKVTYRGERRQKEVCSATYVHKTRQAA